MDYTNTTTVKATKEQFRTDWFDGNFSDALKSKMGLGGIDKVSLNYRHNKGDVLQEDEKSITIKVTNRGVKMQCDITAEEIDDELKIVVKVEELKSSIIQQIILFPFSVITIIGIIPWLIIYYKLRPERIKNFANIFIGAFERHYIIREA